MIVCVLQFSITANVLGISVGCKNESYVYYPSNSSIAFPGIFNASDCVGRIAANNGLDPTGFTATYVNHMLCMIMCFPV